MTLRLAAVLAVWKGMPLRDTPIQRKLMVILLFTSGSVLLLTCVAFLLYDWLTFRQALARRLETHGQIVAINSTAALAFRNRDDAAEILQALKAERRISAAAIYDSQGALFTRYPADLPLDNLPSSPGADGPVFTSKNLTLFQPITLGERRLGTLYIQSGLGALTERIRIYSGIVVLVLAGSLFVAYLLSRMLQRQISAPILHLAEAARAISERRDYSVRAPPAGQDELGVLTGAFNQMLDELQKLNQELESRVIERTTELEVANRELESFSYSVSHDLRAPLRHIDGFAQLLHQKMGDRLDDGERRYLQNISSSARNLGVLIDELLSFSRMGRAELRASRNDTQRLVDAVIQEIQPDARGRNIEWRVGRLPPVEADPAMLRQVWRNLIANAVKYTRGREHAIIRIEHRSDPVEGDVFSVSDNGAGFDMKYAHKLFGVFQRLHSTTEFEGTGIGLANVRRIVHRHGGKTWAEGKVGEGASLFFTLPRTRKDTRSPVVDSGPANGSGR